MMLSKTSALTYESKGIRRKQHLHLHDCAQRSKFLTGLQACFRHSFRNRRLHRLQPKAVSNISPCDKIIVPTSTTSFVNITNQPSFGSNVSVCDNYITLYNSSITQGQFAPVPVEGTIRVVPPFYPVEATLKAQGYRMDNAFIERNYLPCETLKGYSGTGPGDSG